MPTKIEIGSLTIHRIVEQEGPFFEAMQVFPGHDQRAARREPRLAAAQVPRCHRSADALHPELHREDASPHHHDRYLRRQPQAAADAELLEHDEFRSLREEPRGKRIRRERHRFRHVHAFAHRPCRVEHAARERPVGADLPEGALRLRRPRACVLDQAATRTIRPRVRGSPIPYSRSWPPTASTSSRAPTRSTIS